MSFYSLQVIIEGVVGVNSASSIAVDDLSLSENLTCVSVGKPTPPETFEGNASVVLNIYRFDIFDYILLSAFTGLYETCT